MADSGSGTQQNQNSSGSAPGAFSWQGGTTSSTFDPKNFGTQLFGDLSTAYGQGPKINPVSPYTPLSSQTQGLITGANGQATANNAALSPYSTGQMIGNSNPYLNSMIDQTNNQVSQDVNSTFNSNGRFGSDIHAQGLATGLANAGNSARFGQYNTDVNQMLGAQGQQANNTNQALNATGLLDQNAAQQTAANSTMWDRTNNAPYNQIANYLALLQNNGGANAATNKPLSLMDILGGAGSFLGSVL